MKHDVEAFQMNLWKKGGNSVGQLQLALLEELLEEVFKKLPKKITLESFNWILNDPLDELFDEPLEKFWVYFLKKLLSESVK